MNPRIQLVEGRYDQQCCNIKYKTANDLYNKCIGDDTRRSLPGAAIYRTTSQISRATNEQTDGQHHCIKPPHL